MARDLEFFRKQLACPYWQSQHGLLSPNVAEWVLHGGSLTEKLQSVCTQFQVEIIFEGWQAVNFSEKSAKQWVREVVLKCGETDWIFAQTVLPQETIEQVAGAVLALGEQPIGLWLFPQQPERVSLMWQQNKESCFFARRSQWLLKGYPIEIKELFLTDFPFGNEYDTNNFTL